MDISTAISEPFFGLWPRNDNEMKGALRAIKGGVVIF